jgi:long-chain acyl-CoA synthetase
MSGAASARSASATIVDDVFEQAIREPCRIAFLRKDCQRWRSVSVGRFADDVRAAAAGLIAIGVQAGDRVGLIASTGYPWVVCDYAIMAAGAVTVPIYETSSTRQIERILDDSTPRVVFAGDDRLADAVAKAAPPQLRHILVMDGEHLARLAQRGRSAEVQDVERRRLLAADATATIVYTSGTTGEPKGCVLSHRNLAAEADAIVRAPGIGPQVLTPDASVLLCLPLAHVLARAVVLAAVHAGCPVALTGDPRQLPRDLADVRPTVVLGVPRMFEKIWAAARRQAAEAGRLRLFETAAETAVAYSRAAEHSRPDVWLRTGHAAFEQLVYRRVRAGLGGRVRYAVSGGAPLNDRIGRFLDGAGISVLEGWGLTETTAAVTLAVPGEHALGTVGRPLPGYRVRIAEDGEVLLKGPGVFQGYWNNPQATAAAFDADGWLRTGDLGTLRAGHLGIVGRKKDLIVTASGKNVAPEFFEDRLSAHWLIDDCVVVGDKKPYIAALITVDPDAFAHWKAQHGKPGTAVVADLYEDTDLRSAVQSAVDDVNRGAARPEQIKRFRILPDSFTVGAELTATRKVRRDHVLTMFAHEVSALYDDSAPYAK